MSEALPDDLALWPADPNMVLGVDSSADETTLRRAYTRLVRRFKPEQFPEQFRRVREAYDRALETMQQRQFWAEIEQSEEKESDSATVEESVAAVVEASAESPVEKSPSHHKPTQQEDGWKKLAQVSPTHAYRRFVREVATQPADATYLKLYWLLKLWPNVHDRHPCDWLIEGLTRNSDLRGPLWERYRREVHDRPEEVQSLRFEQWLKTTGNLERLAALLTVRWESLARLGAWSTLVTDVNVYRPRFALHDQSRWGYLLGTAMSVLPFSNEKQADVAGREILAEIEEFYSVNSSHQYLLDQVEETSSIAAALQNAERDIAIPRELVRLTRAARLRPFPVLRSWVESFLEDHARRPAHMLEALTSVGRFNMAVLFEFGRLLRTLEYEQGRAHLGPWRETDARQFILDFIDESPYGIYFGQLRPKLLAFCCQHHLPPELIAETIAEMPQYTANEEPISQWIEQDWPLRFACWAHRLTDW